VTDTLGYDDVKAAAGRVGGRVRPVALAEAGERLWFALEFLQHTGSFKARGALNFTAARAEAGAVPEAGIAIASGGNAGLACAWAAREHGVAATVFVPENAPPVKVAALRALGAGVRQVGREYAEAAEACAVFVAESGALASHA
jgi:threonine dehydratase